MGVGQKTLGHRHRQERIARAFDELAHFLIGLGVSCALAENDERLLGALQHIDGALDGVRARNLRRRRIDHLEQRSGALVGVENLGKQFGRQIEIDAARTPRHRGADRARNADADILGVQHAIGRLAKRLCDRKLVHLFIVALHQVDDLALRRARDQNHRPAIGRRMRKRGQAVEEARRRDGEADAGLLGQEAGDRRRIAGVLLVAERDDADAFGLGHAAKIGDRNAGHAVDRFNAVQLERVDDKMEAVRQLLAVGLGLRHFLYLLHSRHHGRPPPKFRRSLASYGLSRSLAHSRIGTTIPP
jgi:hypothetical protein